MSFRSPFFLSSLRYIPTLGYGRERGSSIDQSLGLSFDSPSRLAYDGLQKKEVV